MNHTPRPRSSYAIQPTYRTFRAALWAVPLSLVACAGPTAAEMAADDALTQELSKKATALSPASAATLCLEPVDGRLANGTPVHLVTCDQTSPQQWTLSPASGAIRVGNRMCLDVQDGANRVGAAVQLWQCFNDNNNQKFDVRGSTIRWRTTDKCLDVGGGAISGARLQLAACSDAVASQAWNVRGDAAVAEPAPATAPAPSKDAAPPSPIMIANDQSGTGWGGADLLDPKSTATYRAPSLDGLLAMPNSLVAKQIGNQPDIVAAIRRVTAETGVPSGLLAAMIIQESNGNRNTSSNNPGYGNQPADQRKDVGIIQSPLWRFEGATTAEKLKNGQDPYKNLTVFAQEAMQTYAKTGSWGQVAQVWYTGYIADRLGGVTGGSSQETNYVLNVFAHLAMGGTSYYPTGGY